MKHHRYLSIPAIFLIALVIFVSCQESQDVVLLDEQSFTLEQEAAQAHDLIQSQLDENFANFPENARKGIKKPNQYVFTLVGYDKKADELIYATWDDDLKGWTPVTEEEITAEVVSNSFIFWIMARGLSALEAIEFDAASNDILGEENTIELLEDLLWVTYVNSDIPENTLLKYDIVYDCKGDGLGPIRLDPKINIANGK